MSYAETLPNLADDYSDAQLRKIFVIDHIYNHIKDLYSGSYELQPDMIDSYVKSLQETALEIEAIDPEDSEAMHPVDLKYIAIMNELRAA